MSHRFRFDKGTEPNVYCGPTAIAAVFGIRADVVVDALLRVRAKSSRIRRPRKARVTGMYDDELVQVINEMGHRVMRVPLLGMRADDGKVRLRDFVTRVSGKSRRRFIVSTPSHIVAVDGAVIIDTKTPAGGQWFMDHWCKNWRVKRAWEVLA